MMKMWVCRYVYIYICAYSLLFILESDVRLTFELGFCSMVLYVFLGGGVGGVSWLSLFFLSFCSGDVYRLTGWQSSYVSVSVSVYVCMYVCM